MTQIGSNGFLSAMQRHRGGKVLEDASEKLAAVVAGVLATGKTGSVTIKVHVKTASRGQNAVVMTDDVTAKIPVEKTEDSFWFADNTGSLSKEDPRQKKLKFEPQAIEGGAVEAAATPATQTAVNS